MGSSPGKTRHNKSRAYAYGQSIPNLVTSTPPFQKSTALRAIVESGADANDTEALLGLTKESKGKNAFTLEIQVVCVSPGKRRFMNKQNRKPYVYLTIGL